MSDDNSTNMIIVGGTIMLMILFWVLFAQTADADPLTPGLQSSRVDWDPYTPGYQPIQRRFLDTAPEVPGFQSPMVDVNPWRYGPQSGYSWPNL